MNKSPRSTRGAVRRHCGNCAHRYIGKFCCLLLVRADYMIILHQAAPPGAAQRARGIAQAVPLSSVKPVPLPLATPGTLAAAWRCVKQRQHLPRAFVRVASAPRGILRLISLSRPRGLGRWPASLAGSALRSLRECGCPSPASPWQPSTARLATGRAA